MKTIKTISGYVWASLGIPAVLMMFIGNDFLVENLIVKSGLHVSARWTGAEIERTIEHDQYTTLIHRPVFDGFLWDTPTGFVQIDWKSEQTLPERIDEKIDIDIDGTEDVHVILNTTTNEVSLTGLNPRIVSLSEEGVLIFDDSRTVRIVLKNK